MDRVRGIRGLSHFLVIFSSVVTLIVISCVTLMLTVFRPHLQEGKEYVQWLKDKNSYSPGLIVQENTSSKRARRTPRESSIALAPVDKNFQIDVNGRCLGSAELLTILRRAGFRAQEYALPGDAQRNFRPADESAAIWVGAHVQAAGAIEAMKLALDVWPHLKYIELSTDDSDPPDEVHEALFFGGATSTARERGLRPWTADEIRALPSNSTQAEFHAAIRAKYS